MLWKINSLAIFMILAVALLGFACSDDENQSADGDGLIYDPDTGDCYDMPDWKSEDCYTCETDVDCAPINCCGAYWASNKSCAADCSLKGGFCDCTNNGLRIECPSGIVRCIESHCTTVFSEEFSQEQIATASTTQTANMGCYWAPYMDKDYNADCKPCESDADCVANACCGAQGAVNTSCAPFCDYTICEGCRPDTLDCNQGRVFCNSGGVCDWELTEADGDGEL